MAADISAISVDGLAIALIILGAALVYFKNQWGWLLIVGGFIKPAREALKFK